MSIEEPSRGSVIGTVVCLPVRDLDASLRFYTKVFGLPDLVEEEGMITVELPGLSLFLLGEDQFESYSGKAGRGVRYPDTDVSVILSCAVGSQKDLDSMLTSALQHGGSVPKEAGHDDWTGLYLGYFFDPDGHHWELAFRDTGMPAE
jgi:predicted lactoylglutathione lyase